MSPLYRNPVFFLTWGLPATAVIASVFTLFIAMRGSDGQLPEQYHWEGFRLDRDFSRAARAAELKVHADVAGLDRNGPCELRLRMEGAAPEALLLTLAHGTRAELDRRIAFQRIPAEAGWRISAEPGSRIPIARGSRTQAELELRTPAEPDGGAVLYRGVCTDLPEAHWRVELVDSVNGWAIRKSVRSSLGALSLGAVTGNHDAVGGNLGAATGKLHVAPGNLGAATANLDAAAENLGAATGRLHIAPGNLGAATANLDAATGNGG